MSWFATFRHIEQYLGYFGYIHVRGCLREAQDTLPHTSPPHTRSGTSVSLHLDNTQNPPIMFLTHASTALENALHKRLLTSLQYKYAKRKRSFTAPLLLLGCSGVYHHASPEQELLSGAADNYSLYIECTRQSQDQKTTILEVCCHENSAVGTAHFKWTESSLM